MKFRTLHKNFLLAAAMMFVVVGSAKADGVDLADVLHGGPTCDHVINLMLRHGVNNSHGLAATEPRPSFALGADARARGRTRGFRTGPSCSAGGR